MFGDDSSSSKLPSVQTFFRGDARSLIALGVSAYALTLAATPPASLAARLAGRPGALAAIGGTVWDGQALLDGGHRLDWRLAPLRSLTSLSLAAAWRIEGPDTRLEGAAGIGPGGIAVSDVSGRLDWSLIAAVAPGLPVTCATNIRVDIARAVIGRRGPKAIEGEAEAGAGRCAPAEGETAGFDIPALRAVAAREGDGVAIRLTPAGDTSSLLAGATLSDDGRLALTLEPAGAELFHARPVTLETQL